MRKKQVNAVEGGRHKRGRDASYVGLPQPIVHHLVANRPPQLNVDVDPRLNTSIRFALPDSMKELCSLLGPSKPSGMAAGPLRHHTTGDFFETLLCMNSCMVACF